MIRTIVVLALLCAISPAQTYVKAGTTISGNLGFKNPALAVTVGHDHAWKRVLVLGAAGFNTGNKMDTGDGTSVRLSGAIYARFNERFALGGGAGYTKLYTSAYEKSSVRPNVGLVYADRHARYRFEYVFTGNDRVNRLQGARGEVVAPLHPRWAFEYSLGVYRLSPSFQTSRLTAIENLIALRFYLGRRG